MTHQKSLLRLIFFFLFFIKHQYHHFSIIKLFLEAFLMCEFKFNVHSLNCIHQCLTLIIFLCHKSKSNFLSSCLLAFCVCSYISLLFSMLSYEMMTSTLFFSLKLRFQNGAFTVSACILCLKRQYTF